MTKLSLSSGSSRPLQLGQKLVHGLIPPTPGSQVFRTLTKSNENKDCQEPPSSNLPQAPPTWFSPPSSPLLACRMALGRGDLQSGHLVAPPPHVSLSVHPHPSHLVPPVHQYGPLEIGNIDPLLELPVQGVGVAPSGAHSVDHVHPPLMMMERVEPKNRFLLISGFQIVQMLSSPGVAVPPTLPLVRTNFRSAFLAPEFITNTFSPAISSTLSLALEAIISATFSSRPRI